MNQPSRLPRAATWFVATLLGSVLLLEGSSLYTSRKLALESRLIRTEIKELRSAVTTGERSIPPLFGARHISLRQRFIADQVSQGKSAAGLVLGDSIVEGMFLGDVSPSPMINGGMGGAGVEHLRELLDQIAAFKVPLVVIAIGVNDTVKTTQARDLTAWTSSYRDVVERAKRMANGKVLVSTILPVERGKPLGSDYFDPSVIRRSNEVIRTVAKESGVMLVDNDPAFAQLSGSTSFTTDGVHLTPAAYAVLTQNLKAALRAR